MYGSLRVLVKPAIEAVSLTDLQAHLRVSQENDAPLVRQYGRAARQYIESVTSRSLINQTFRYSLAEPVRREYRVIRHHRFANEETIELPRSPVQQLVEVSRRDGTVLDASRDFWADVTTDPARIRVRHERNIRLGITFVAGYGETADDVPEDLLMAIKIMAAWFYEHRGDNAATLGAPPEAITWLIAPYRVFTFG